MEFHRSYSPLYKCYLKDDFEPPSAGFKLRVKSKKEKVKAFEKIVKVSPDRTYVLKTIEDDGGEAFSSGTLDRQKQTTRRKLIKIEEIPLESDEPKVLKRLMSIQNLPETIEIPHNVDSKAIEKKHSVRKIVVPAKKGDSVIVAEKKCRKKTLKIKPFVIHKPNPVFKPKPKPQKNPLNHIVNDENSDKSVDSSVNSLEFSIMIDYDNLDTHYQPKLAKSGNTKDFLKNTIFAKNLIKDNSNPNLSVIGKKFEINSHSFIKEKSLKALKTQPYFFPYKRSSGKKNFKWMALKPAVIDFSKGFRRYKENPSSYSVVSNTYAKIRNVNSQKVIRPLFM